MRTELYTIQKAIQVQASPPTFSPRRLTKQSVFFRRHFETLRNRAIALYHRPEERQVFNAGRPFTISKTKKIIVYVYNNNTAQTVPD